MKSLEIAIPGRTECNRVVNLAAPERLVGQLAEVRISAVRGHTLRGSLLAA